MKLSEEISDLSMKVFNLRAEVRLAETSEEDERDLLRHLETAEWALGWVSARLSVQYKL